MTEAVQKQWLDLYPDEIPHHIDYDERPLYAYLQEAAKEQPDKIALHFMGKELSYREVYESAP